jgi:hypothetical protein
VIVARCDRCGREEQARDLAGTFHAPRGHFFARPREWQRLGESDVCAECMRVFVESTPEPPPPPRSGPFDYGAPMSGVLGTPYDDPDGESS